MILHVIYTDRKWYVVKVEHITRNINVTNTLSFWGADAFVIKQAHVARKTCVQKGHIVRLSLDGVRENHITLIVEQTLLGELLDTKDTIGRRQVLGNSGTRLAKLVVGEDPPM